MFFKRPLFKLRRRNKRKWLLLFLAVCVVYIISYISYDWFMGTPTGNISFDRPLMLSEDYIINNVTICRDVENVTVLVMVHSAVDHYQQRQNIRLTYGSRDLFTPAEIRVIFLLGRPRKSQSEQNHILEESTLYGDIIQGDFLDTYQNLTHKAVMGLRWVSENCRNAKYILKVDDDVVFDMWKFLTRFPDSGRMKTVWCSVLTYQFIMRQGKWGVPSYQFPGLWMYPFRYCKGIAVILTGDIVPELFKMAHITPFFWLDDAYVYGMLLPRIRDSSLESFPAKFGLMAPPYLSMLCQAVSVCRDQFVALGVKSSSFLHTWNSVQKQYES